MINTTGKLHETDETVRRLLQRKNVRESLKQFDSDITIRYISELYKGNGWIVSCHAPSGHPSALLLSYPKNPQQTVLIVRIDCSTHELSFEDCRDHLLYFENELSALYSCSQFCLVALNSFEARAEKLESFNLLLQDWSYVEELIENYSVDKIKEPRIQLFAHNKIAYRKVLKKWGNHRSVAVVQATGTGKSFLIAKILQDFTGSRRLVMAPSNYIIDQLKEHIRWDIEEIKFMTYTKSMFLSESEVQSLRPELIVLDEFHRCGAEEWGRGVNNILNAHPEAFKFGTSATPVRYMDNARDMSNELFNGNVAENLGLAQAIVRNILPMPKYICALYTIDEETNELKERIASSGKSAERKKQLLLELDTFAIDWERSHGIASVLKKHLQKKMHKFIVFCRDAEHLLEMEPVVKKWFKDATNNFPVKTYRVYDNEPNIDKQLKAFKYDTSKDFIHLLFSINMLNEGVHVSDVHGVILLRPTESPNIFYQQIGRCLKVGLNHQPVIFDFVNNFKSIRTDDFLYDLGVEYQNHLDARTEERLEDRSPKFTVHDEVREITEVFGEIRFKLDNWDNYYDRLVGFKKQFGHCNVVKGMLENDSLYRWVLEQQRRFYYGKLHEDRFKLLNDLGFEWKSEVKLPVDEQWEINFEKLCEFRKTNGHTNVSRLVHARLCDFVRLQRERYKKGGLETYRINKLNSIGFEWERQTFIEGIWQQRFDQLSAYKNENGHCNVSFSENHSLAVWVMKQRADFKKGLMDMVRQQKLDSIGFEWKRFLPDDEMFQKKFEEIKQFKLRHGHFTFPENSPLEYYSYKLRKQFKDGSLSEERIQRLKSIDFPFKISRSNSTVYINNIQKLHPFFAIHGHCNITEKQGTSLYTWLNHQRNYYHKGALDSIIVEQLNALRIDWNFNKNTAARQWEAKYNLVKEYYLEHGNIEVSKQDKKNIPLNYWIVRQRRDFKKRLLTNEQVEKLKQVNFLFETDTWYERFEDLVEYKKAHGHCRVPQLKGKYKILANWCGNIRQRYKNGVLSPERIQQAEALGFKWDLEEDMWRTSYEDLKAFLQKYLWSDLPAKNPRLYNFSNTQRSTRRKNNLSEERIILMNKLEIDWNPSANQWDKMYKQLFQYVTKNRTTNVTAVNKETEKLRKWCYTQRCSFRNNELSAEQIRTLNEINFPWDVKMGRKS